MRPVAAAALLLVPAFFVAPVGGTGSAAAPRVTETDCPYDTAVWTGLTDPEWYCDYDAFTHTASVTGYVVELRFHATQPGLGTWLLRVGSVHDVAGINDPRQETWQMDEVARVRGESPLRIVLPASLFEVGVHYTIWEAPDPDQPAALVLTDQGASHERATFDGVAFDPAFPLFAGQAA